MTVDIQACTRQEPTPDLIRELSTACGVPGVHARCGADEWPGLIECEHGPLCFVTEPEVLADPEDVDELLTETTSLAAEELPLWLVTLTPSTGSGDDAETTTNALAEGLVKQCGGWAFSAGDVVASGPDLTATAPTTEPLTFTAITPAEPPADLLAKVRERHVTVSTPTLVDSSWVTKLGTDPSTPASTPLALAVAAAELVIHAEADVFDQAGERLPLPHADLTD